MEERIELNALRKEVEQFRAEQASESALMEHVFANTITLQYTPTGTPKSISLIIGFLTERGVFSNFTNSSSFASSTLKRVLLSFQNAFKKHISSPVWVQPYSSVHWIAASWALAHEVQKNLKVLQPTTTAKPTKSTTEREEGEEEEGEGEGEGIDEELKMSKLFYAAVARGALDEQSPLVTAAERATWTFLTLVHEVFATSVRKACDIIGPMILRAINIDETSEQQQQQQEREEEEREEEEIRRIESERLSEVINVLTELSHCMNECALHNFLRLQYFTQLLHFIDAILFNRLIGNSSNGEVQQKKEDTSNKGEELKNNNMCSCSEGVRVRLALSAVEEWLHHAPELLSAQSQLCHIREAANLLVMDKSILKDEDATAHAFNCLNPAKLLAILKQFKPDKLANQPVDPELIKFVEKKVKPEMEIILDPYNWVEPSEIPITSLKQ